MSIACPKALALINMLPPDQTSQIQCLPDASDCIFLQPKSLQVMLLGADGRCSPKHLENARLQKAAHGCPLLQILFCPFNFCFRRDREVSEHAHEDLLWSWIIETSAILAKDSLFFVIYSLFISIPPVFGSRRIH